MSFDSGKGLMEAYRDVTRTALNNEKPPKWFLTVAGGLDPAKEAFESKTENSDWESEVKKPYNNTIKVQAPRLRVHWLVGCRQAVCNMFKHIPLDNDRFEHMRLLHHILMTNLLKDVTKTKKDG